MPNTRRRRFSVQNDIATRDPSKMQNASSNRHLGSNTDIANHNMSNLKISKSKNKSFPNSSKNINTLEIVAERDSDISLSVRKQSTITIDSDIIANSNNIDVFIQHTDTDDKTANEQSKEIINSNESKRRDEGLRSRDITPRRVDKHPRQHRIKVRSPRRRMSIPDHCKTNDNNRRSVGTTAIDWNQEVGVTLVEHIVIDTETSEEPRLSEQSLDDMCRICHGGGTLSLELGALISACSCRGTVGRVHVKCLERWLTESGKSRCELCGTRYATRRVHKYGVPRALFMWILSQNAKQLMVDSLGIMLMSPLAVLAAWLSGRTLAGLMTQESHVTPWPLASTFVLACMTLVCYYCWIVSAATRHALGWWIWYRSQYEVRLQFQDNED
ncbi:uncharacterized protein LOC131855197 [Achroia grisella]|uniref:uncharacterized protein LOC131855197 n=1 Tax=Achroia grisella TaxID=688607 RepID=UPI0027D299E7|nr:uncharacterized protein LOC131855197 [Achroia grisella]